MIHTEQLIHDLKQLGKYSSLEPNWLRLAAEKIEELSGKQIKTNYDRIRNMSVEEMAEIMNGTVDKVCFDLCERNTENKFQCPYETHNCAQCIVIWLESEATE